MRKPRKYAESGLPGRWFPVTDWRAGRGKSQTGKTSFLNPEIQNYCFLCHGAGSVEKEKRRKTASFAAFEQAEKEGKKDAAKPE